MFFEIKDNVAIHGSAGSTGNSSSVLPSLKQRLGYVCFGAARRVARGQRSSPRTGFEHAKPEQVGDIRGEAIDFSLQLRCVVQVKSERAARELSPRNQNAATGPEKASAGLEPGSLAQGVAAAFARDGSCL